MPAPGLLAERHEPSYAPSPMVREILQLGNPLLHERCHKVEGSAEATIRDLCDTLAAFRGRSGFGRGIAAPQIGRLERGIFIRMPLGFTGAGVKLTDWIRAELRVAPGTTSRPLIDSRWPPHYLNE